MNSENFTLFSKLDIRVGKIIDAEIFKQAIKPAYILTIDFGQDIGLKKTSAQITNYELQSLSNKKCIAVINLGEKQIGPIMSQCLILGSIKSNGDVLLLSPEDGSEIGDRIA
tara:strand:+ start:1863 stop:2198 length:336 start_codon:yes stop_codon:yes gene_type:complete